MKELTELQLFKNDQFEIRTTVKDGQPLFVAADVCKALDLDNNRKAAERLDEDEKADVTLSDGSQMRHMTAVTESGLYALVLGSRKPEAKAFKRWITHDVIPAIRNTGMYATDTLLANPDLAIAAFTALKEERARVKSLKEKIEADKPQVLFAETVQKSCDNILIRDMAKLLHQEEIEIGEKRLYRLLRRNNIFMEDNAPYQTYIDRGYFCVKESHYTTPYGVIKLANTTLITPKGQVWLVEKVRSWLSNTTEEGEDAV